MSRVASTGSTGLFARLRDGLNIDNYEDRRDVFVECVLEAVDCIPTPPTILDIGCGSGIRRDREPQKTIASRAAHFWGLDPDPNVEIDRDLFEQFWPTTVEEASIPSSSVDVAYAHMVVEHVADGQRFCQKIHDILKPGGRAVFLTINAKSYLGRASRITHALGLQDFIVRLARGPDVVEGYHYPALYRLNIEKSIERVARGAGFSSAEFAYLDRGEARVYFPRFARWIPRCIEYKHRVLKQREHLTNLLIMLVKAGT